jgi:hypothetical protein
MNRRVFLKSTITGTFGALAGCSGESEKPDLPLSVKITEVDELDERLQVGIDVEVLNNEVTSDDPALIQITITNQADTEQTIYSGSVPVFTDLVSTEMNGNRIILRRYTTNTTGTYNTDKVADDCWQWDNDRVGTSTIAWSEDLAPEATVSEEFIIFGHPDNATPCLPPGEYRFENDGYRLNEDDSEAGFTWGFSVLIEN